MSRLGEYLKRKQAGGFGWRVDYDRTIGEDKAYLLGHYGGMLDELIDMIGVEKLRALVAAHEDITKPLFPAPPGKMWATVLVDEAVAKAMIAGQCQVSVGYSQDAAPTLQGAPVETAGTTFDEVPPRADEEDDGLEEHDTAMAFRMSGLAPKPGFRRR